ncbi:uncharacterized protein YbjT (DUF2867 family) [Lipingzhangella halophila]|uniref:Uncharacterized protein YbjT (DUF2867 family) n=1 Tax=Lipingzhangella halophila TaxID=1783352 RepID=A0A7W7W4C2_9ACTN|nr:NAD(P)H-binding protein [Lipingzhangella halophila]MBB4932699.1 uncharacterized protein YbjT (DUF2867 family) [Lipingzhangella halophila]
MRLTIVAATGGIGRHLLQQAVAAGHDVTAVVRDPEKLDVDVRAVKTDLTAPEPEALSSAFGGTDAVLSALGPRTRKDLGILAPGTRAVVDAMALAGAGRILVVSGTGVSTVPTPGNPNPSKREPGAGFRVNYIATPLARIVLGAHFADVALMEDVLRGSGLDWTAVQVPLLTNGPLTGTYRQARGRRVRGGLRLARADAAHFMLRAIGRPETFGHPITAAY